ncbi:MAG TPA: hypothetical protein VN732_05515 [Solirubrobacterales bacterium]|nr:hypothetical protein [Solirubrobacterales bacterium]
MREKLNENPLAQAAVIGVLLLLAIVMLMVMKGGGEAETEAAPEAEPSLTTGEAGITPAPEGEAPAAASAAAAGATILPTADVPPTPKAVAAAWDSGATVVLLIVRAGGIDDRMVRSATEALAAVPDVSLFVVPAREIARFASITAGAGVNRTPALVVLRPKALSNGTPTASVSYGYQKTQSVLQAVVDARYKGRTLSYHP